MNIEISKSSKSDKKLNAVIDGKRLFTLGNQVLPITHSIKAPSENNARRITLYDLYLPLPPCIQC